MRHGRWKRVISLLLSVSVLASTGITAAATENMPIDAAELAVEHVQQSALTLDYTIYPLVREKTYGEGGFDFGNEVHVVYSDGIDEVTRKLAHEKLEGLASKPQILEGSTVTEGAVNVLVGVWGDNGAADAAVQDVSPNMTIQSNGKTYENVDIFEHKEAHDSYILKVENNTVAVVGKTTDAAFYGLTTLGMIIDEMAENGTSTIRNLTIRDYASVAHRGFIEGYYGIPWGVENRCMLMDWGGQWKMNEYFYAPKNDPKHNSAWRDPYTPAELEEFRRMAQVGNETKCRFIYSLHTFMNKPIRFDEHYEQDLKIVLDKFESLYNVGVRQFAILADDAKGTSAENIVRLCNDVDNWGKQKQGVYPMLHCPTSYNASWTNEEGFRGLGKLDEKLNEGIEVMWTGKGVCGHADQEGAESYTKNIAKHYYGNEAQVDRVGRPLMWLNWPVDDINMSRLVLGPGSNEGGSALWGSGSVAVLEKGDADYFSGVISNPMQQPSANKIPLFAVADFAWNDDDYNGMQSWEDSFRFVDPNASEELHEIAKHTSDPAPNTHGMVCGESEEIKESLESFLNTYRAGTLDHEKAEALNGIFQTIIRACDDFMKKSQDEGLKKDIGPFAKALSYLAQSGIELIKTTYALEKGHTSDVWSHYSQATALLAQSENVTEVPIIDGSLKAAMPGSKRLRPFMNGMVEILEPKVGEIVNPNYQSVKFYLGGLMDSYYGNTKGKATDGDPKTVAHIYASTNQSPNHTAYKPGEVVFGLTYSSPVTITHFRFLSVDSGDKFGAGKLEYKVAGETEFREAGTFTTSHEWDFSAEPLKNVVDIRVVNTENITTWVKVAEMGIFTPGESKPEATLTWTYESSNLVNGNSASFSFGALTDDNPNNYGHFEHKDTAMTADAIKAGDEITLVLEEATELGQITIRQGKNDSDGDKMKNAVLEYSMDGTRYTPIRSNINDNVVSLDVSDQNIKAKYVRLRNGEDISKWFALREFSVERRDQTYFAENLANGNDASGAISFDKLKNSDANDYIHIEHYPEKAELRDAIFAGDAIGIRFAKPTKLGRIVIRQGKNDSDGDRMYDAVLEYSMDGTAYTPIREGINANNFEIDLSSAGITANYLRLRNGKDQKVWLALREFSVTEAIAKDPVYTNVSKYRGFVAAIGDDTAVLGPVADEMTLQPNEYIGIKLPRIRDVVEVRMDATNANDLVVELGANPMEMKPYAAKASGTPARYVVVRNNGNAAVTFRLNELFVRSHEIFPISMHSNNMGGYYENNGLANMFDGKLGTEMVLAQHQAPEKAFVVDLGQPMTIDTLQIINNDSAQDYIRYARIDTATTLENGGDWTELMNIGGASNGTDTPIIQAEGWTHTISYSYAGSKPDDTPLGREARYLRITLLSNANKWVRIRELAINSMINGNDYTKPYFQTVNDPTMEGSKEKIGYPALNLIDGNVRTTYRPADTAAGSMLYRLSDNLEDVHTLTILQNPNTLSGAVVSVRPANQENFIEVGRLMSSLNEFSLQSLDTVAEVRIDWEAEKAPELYEIYISAKTTEAPNKAALKDAIDRAKAYDTTGHDQTLVNALKDALNNAQSIYDSPYVKQSMVDDAVRALENALGALASDQMVANRPVKVRDEATNVGISAAAGVLPNVTQLRVTPVTEGTLFELIETTLSNAIETFTAFDVYAFVAAKSAGNVGVQPKDGTAQLYFPLPEGTQAKDLRVFEIQGSGDYQQIEATIVRAGDTEHVPDGYNADAQLVTFPSDHFSAGSAFVIGKAKAEVVPPVVEYTLRFEANGGSFIAPLVRTAGTVVELASYVPMRPGYTFEGWYTDAELTNCVSSVTLNQDTTVYAGWFGGGHHDHNQNNNQEADKPAAVPFNDISSNDWFYDAVKYSYENGLMNGITETEFAPHGRLTRAMLAQILYNRADKPAVTEDGQFTDIQETDWFADAVNWAAKEGIVSGMGDGSFASDAFITREQLALMLYRAAGSPAVSDKALDFADAANISDWAMNAVRWAVENGIMNGKGNGMLDPNGTATRAEVAKMMMGFEKIAD